MNKQKYCHTEGKISNSSVFLDTLYSFDGNEDHGVDQVVEKDHLNQNEDKHHFYLDSAAIALKMKPIPAQLFTSESSSTFRQIGECLH